MDATVILPRSVHVDSGRRPPIVAANTSDQCISLWFAPGSLYSSALNSPQSHTFTRSKPTGSLRHDKISSIGGRYPRDVREQFEFRQRSFATVENNLLQAIKGLLSEGTAAETGEDLN